MRLWVSTIRIFLDNLYLIFRLLKFYIIPKVLVFVLTTNQNLINQLKKHSN